MAAVLNDDDDADTGAGEIFSGSGTAAAPPPAAAAAAAAAVPLGRRAAVSASSATSSASASARLLRARAARSPSSASLSSSSTLPPASTSTAAPTATAASSGGLLSSIEGGDAAAIAAAIDWAAASAANSATIVAAPGRPSTATSASTILLRGADNDPSLLEELKASLNFAAADTADGSDSALMREADEILQLAAVDTAELTLPFAAAATAAAGPPELPEKTRATDLTDRSQSRVSERMLDDADPLRPAPSQLHPRRRSSVIRPSSRESPSFVASADEKNPSITSSFAQNKSSDSSTRTSNEEARPVPYEPPSSFLPFRRRHQQSSSGSNGEPGLLKDLAHTFRRKKSSTALTDGPPLQSLGESILHKGYFSKKRDDVGGMLLGKWTTEFGVLCAGRFYLFSTSRPSERAHSLMSLDESTKIIRQPRSALVVMASGAPFSSSWHLQCENEKELDDWVTTLTAAAGLITRDETEALTPASREGLWSSRSKSVSRPFQDDTGGVMLGRRNSARGKTAGSPLGGPAAAVAAVAEDKPAMPQQPWEAAVPAPQLESFSPEHLATNIRSQSPVVGRSLPLEANAGLPRHPSPLPSQEVDRHARPSLPHDLYRSAPADLVGLTSVDAAPLPDSTVTDHLRFQTADRDKMRKTIEQALLLHHKDKASAAAPKANTTVEYGALPPASTARAPRPSRPGPPTSAAATASSTPQFFPPKQSAVRTSASYATTSAAPSHAQYLAPPLIKPGTATAASSASNPLIHPAIPFTSNDLRGGAYSTGASSPSLLSDAAASDSAYPRPVGAAAGTSPGMSWKSSLPRVLGEPVLGTTTPPGGRARGMTSVAGSQAAQLQSLGALHSYLSATLGGQQQQQVPSSGFTPPAKAGAAPLAIHRAPSPLGAAGVSQNYNNLHHHANTHAHRPRFGSSSSDIGVPSSSLSSSPSSARALAAVAKTLTSRTPDP
ncbi:hypothetical protein HK405_007476, partial [Cladochytrium tenue]